MGIKCFAVSYAYQGSQCMNLAGRIVYLRIWLLDAGVSMLLLVEVGRFRASSRFAVGIYWGGSLKAKNDYKCDHLECGFVPNCPVLFEVKVHLF